VQRSDTSPAISAGTIAGRQELTRNNAAVQGNPASDRNRWGKISNFGNDKTLALLPGSCRLVFWTATGSQPFVALVNGLFGP